MYQIIAEYSKVKYLKADPTTLSSSDRPPRAPYGDPHFTSPLALALTWPVYLVKDILRDRDRYKDTRMRRGTVP